MSAGVEFETNKNVEDVVKILFTYCKLFSVKLFFEVV